MTYAGIAEISKTRIDLGLPERNFPLDFQRAILVLSSRRH